MKRPTNLDIKKYLQENKPLGQKVNVKNVSFLGGGNHYNYKIETNSGNYVVRVSRLDGLGAGVLFDIPDEFTLLKLLSKHKVSPKVFSVDLERFSLPLLIEECIAGIPYIDFKKINKQKTEAVIDLMVKVSNISLDEKEFPFRFSYHYYNTNIRVWNARMNEIRKLSKNKKVVNDFVKDASKVIKRASEILLNNQSILDKAKKVFIYNDVHAGNIFWLPKEKKALFIDWQKVSTGDPAFMLAVFALAFEKRIGDDRDKFFNEIISVYEKKSGVKNLKKLFWLRILEREVANMIWVVWATLKQGKKLPFSQIDKYDRYIRTTNLVSNFS